MTTSISELLPANVPTTSTTSATLGNDDLDQGDFLTLMVAQLQNQDPTNPADTSTFTSQLAEFSVVQGVSELNTSFAQFADVFSGSQTIDAINLVGRSVTTGTNVGYLNEGEEMNATVNMPQFSSSASLYVQDEYGEIVDQISLGPLSEGQHEVTWDGTDLDGNPVDPGKYRLSVEATIGGQTQSISTFAHNEVASVVLNNQAGTYKLRLADGSSASLAEILGIYQ